MIDRVIFIYGAIAFFLAFFVIWMVSYFWKKSTPSDRDSLISAKLSRNLGEEKREHPRTDVNWPVSIETAYETIAAEVKNISLGGAFICCKKPLQLRKVFRMTMIGPENEPMTVSAQVAWSNANMPEDKVINRGMGVRFINMSDRHIQLLRQVCQ
jgi:Tfp pilus assembly protein PilZ